MSDRILSQAREARMPGGQVWTLTAGRSADGAPRMFFTIESKMPDPKDQGIELLNREMTIFIDDGDVFLAPVMEWLNRDKLAVSETPAVSADDVIQRAVNLAKEIDSINLAIHEAKTASGSAGQKLSAFFESDLFTTLNNYREDLRKQLLALTQKD